MKLPISFGNKLFFRVLLPGAILTAAFARISQAVFTALWFKASDRLCVSSRDIAVRLVHARTGHAGLHAF
jgi:hypothetical protein